MCFYHVSGFRFFGGLGRMFAGALKNELYIHVPFGEDDGEANRNDHGAVVSEFFLEFL